MLKTLIIPLLIFLTHPLYGDEKEHACSLEHFIEEINEVRSAIHHHSIEIAWNKFKRMEKAFYNSLYPPFVVKELYKTKLALIKLEKGYLQNSLKEMPLDKFICHLLFCLQNLTASSSHIKSVSFHMDLLIKLEPCWQNHLIIPCRTNLRKDLLPYEQYYQKAYSYYLDSKAAFQGDDRDKGELNLKLAILELEWALDSIQKNSQSNSTLPTANLEEKHLIQSYKYKGISNPKADITDSVSLPLELDQILDLLAQLEQEDFAILKNETQ